MCMDKGPRYIGGEYSWQSIVPYFSAEAEDFSFLFPDSIEDNVLELYQTGIDALCSILIEATKPITSFEKIELWFPEHYCLSSLERVKLALRSVASTIDFSIRSYIHINDIDNKQEKLIIVVVMYFNLWEEQISQQVISLKKTGAKVIEDFVLSPFDLKRMQGDYAFNSLRKIVPLDVAVAYKKIPDAEKKYDYKYESYRRAAMNLKSLVENGLENDYESDYLSLYRKAEMRLAGREQIIHASPDTVNLIRKVAFLEIQEARRQNYDYIRNNILLKEGVCSLPGDYMFFMITSTNRNKMREYFFDKGIFPAIHWEGTANDKSKTILSLPIDQRYSKGSLKRLVAAFNKFFDEN